MGVTKTAAATFGDNDFLAIPHQISHDLAGFISCYSADRHRHDQIFAAAAMLTSFIARLPGLGPDFFLITKSGQSVLVTAGLQNDIATIAAITAVRATL